MTLGSKPKVQTALRWETPASSSSRYRLLQNGTPRQALHICAGTSSPASNRSIYLRIWCGLCVCNAMSGLGHSRPHARDRRSHDFRYAIMADTIDAVGYFATSAMGHSRRAGCVRQCLISGQKQTTQRLLSVDGGSPADYLFDNSKLGNSGQLNMCDTVLASGRYVRPGFGRTSS